MKALSLLAVDDEVPALEDLARMLRALPDVGDVAAVSSGAEALRALSERRYDGLFLDVRMPELDGLELAAVIKRFEHPPPVVFVSAYETGAVGAFELKALDYLLKPVSRTRLADAVTRVGQAGADAAAGPREMVALTTARGGTRRVARDSILYMQAQGDYVRIVADDGRFIERGTISDLERKLATHGFVRVHRGYLANLARAEEVRPQGNGTATLAFPGGDEIPIARRKVTELRRRIAQ